MVQPVVMTQGTLLTAGTVTYYTSPTKTTTVVKKCTVTNTDGAGGHTFTIYKVPSGNSAGIANVVIDAQTIGALQTMDVTEMINKVLAAGDTIQALADTGALVNIQMDGVQIA